MRRGPKLLYQQKCLIYRSLFELNQSRFFSKFISTAVLRKPQEYGSNFWSTETRVSDVLTSPTQNILKSKDFYKENKRRLTRILELRIKRNKILRPPRDGELKNEIKIFSVFDA